MTFDWRLWFQTSDVRKNRSTSKMSKNSYFLLQGSKVKGQLLKDIKLNIWITRESHETFLRFRSRCRAAFAFGVNLQTAEGNSLCKLQKSF